VEELKPDLDAAAKAIEAFLRALGHSADTEPELRDTPRLVARAFHDELLSGYRMDPAAILGEAMTAPGGELLVVRDLRTTLICPHHLLPAAATVALAYAPGARIAGLGALARLVDCFARRLVLQETLGQQLADALCTHLGARGAAALVQAEPGCLTARGERQHAASVHSIACAGSFGDERALGAVFAALATGAATERRS
jgi:GTP cyclohydrolase I